MRLPYSYVPGRFPHPMTSPEGHGMGHRELSVGEFDERTWPGSDVYRWGVELFNDGYYWESHECWEAVWHHAGRRGTVADMLKGLIKLSAAGVKAREGREAGVRSHAARAAELFRRVRRDRPKSPSFLGLELDWLIERSARLSEDAANVVDTSAEPVVVVMPFRLTLSNDETPEVEPNSEQQRRTR